jgi:hypothetical protein
MEVIMGNANIKPKQDISSAGKGGTAALRAVPGAAKPPEIVKSLLDAVVQRGDIDFVLTLIAEDCAWCGIWRPAARPRRRRPVFRPHG